MTDTEWITTWFERSYKPLDGRYNTMKRALELVHKRFLGPLILETGCARQANDWGAGLSTVVFSDFLHQAGMGRLISVDINSRNVSICEGLTAQWAHLRSVVCSDSVAYLEELPASQFIDLLYLDSWDYPIIEICDLYGPRSDFEENLKMLREKGDEWVLEQHGDMIAPSQDHCLLEIKAALPHLTRDSVVLIDDVSFPGGGKSRLAEQFLRENGWVQIAREHQSLWVHESTKEANSVRID